MRLLFFVVNVYINLKSNIPITSHSEPSVSKYINSIRPQFESLIIFKSLRFIFPLKKQVKNVFLKEFDS